MAKRAPRLQAHMIASREKMRLLDEIFDRAALAQKTAAEREALGRQWKAAVDAESRTWEVLTLKERGQAHALWAAEEAS